MPQSTKSATTLKRTSRLPETRVTPDELAAVKRKAAKLHLSVSEYQRRALLKPKVIIRQDGADPKVVSNLFSIGNNLNQLTRKTHIHDEYDRERLHEVLNIIEELALKLANGS